MKKVLILTYYWPPSGGAGVQRWLKFVKYLREFNWEPVVYTALNGEIPVIDHSLEKDIPKGITVLKTPIWEPYNFYKKFSGRKKEDKINASFLNENKKAGLAEKISVYIRGNYFIPDARKFWIKPSIQFLSDYLNKNKIDYIISSGPPHSMHLIALGIKEKFPNIKWLADFRDPWTNIDFYEKLMLSKRADRLHHEMELKVLMNADCVLSIGQAMSEEFKEMYLKAGGKNKDKFKVITNGFDEEVSEELKVIPDAKFTMAHIGTLVKDRNPEILWRVLKELISENIEFEKKFELKLVGKVDISVMEDLEKFGLKKYLNKIDYLPHDQVILEQKKSAVLLLLVNNTKNAKGILTGKFFEYMASGRPVLAIGPVNGDLAEIIKETSCGYISNFDDVVSLKKNILELFENRNVPSSNGNIQKYSRKSLTGKLAEVLNNIL
ncbi:MAG: glycosyltransferase family 4 protein [Sphingobacteriaceae bacterium]|nr:glycosyltransferase family 4 protein [Sphingobacteriaceae bacterium]